MFTFTKFSLLECAGCFNVANGRDSLLDLFPDVSTIVDSELFRPNRPFVNSRLFWQLQKIGNVKLISYNINVVKACECFCR